jgi:hypothetical protein
LEVASRNSDIGKFENRPLGPTIYFNFLDPAHFLHGSNRGLDKRIGDLALVESQTANRRRAIVREAGLSAKRVRTQAKLSLVS